MCEIVDFIANYDSSYESRICFNWNGKSSDDFSDSNMEFRALVLQGVLLDVSAAPIILIRDLFLAETRFSARAWCIGEGLDELAESLLRRGGVDYLDDYLEGKFQSFDASCGSVFKYDLELAESMLEGVQNRLRSEPQSSQADLWRLGEKLFRDWVADCRNQPT